MLRALKTIISIFKKFGLLQGITTILQQDNFRRQIPLTHRLNVELDIQGALSSGTFTVARDLLNKIRALNIIRCVLDQKPIYHGSFSYEKNSEILVWVMYLNDILGLK